MDHFLIINLIKQIKFQVYKYEGFSHDKIGDEIIDERAFVLVELGFQES